MMRPRVSVVFLVAVFAVLMAGITHAAAPVVSHDLTPVSDTAAIMPRHGTVSIAPARKWEDSLAAGNGTMGALLAGDPRQDTLIANHCKLWLPLGSREVVPDVGRFLPELRKIIAEKGYGAAQKFFEDKAREQGWNGKLIWTDPFHPGFFLKIDQPADGPITDYARVENFNTGEVWTQWRSKEGPFSRRLFVSRTDNLIVLKLTGPAGKLSLRLSIPPIGNKLIQGTFVHEKQWITSHNTYVNGKGGYDSAVRIATSGGTVTNDVSSVSIRNADSVTLIMRLEPYKTAAPDSLAKLTASLSACTMDYDTLLKPHAAAHRRDLQSREHRPGRWR